jgi:hypothetical protein
MSPEGFSNNIQAKSLTTRLEKKGNVIKKRRNTFNLGFCREIHKAVG